MYWGDMGVNYWDGDLWKGEMEKHEVRGLCISIATNGCPSYFI
jgi:hypothetical protein